MNTHTATALARHLGRLLCWHLALAMLCTAGYTLSAIHTHRTVLYLTWAALPLTALLWATTRALEKHHLNRDRAADTTHTSDWTPAA
ncbi:MULTISPECIES: hypothetical protein [unclassified Streptomyces]|uniref:hypothetical protein n=1 Tax=unclassified Streptomyces TaxID=2593676 RepID=UPI000DBA0E96|nr:MULTISPECIES: hypothetical protein [unclassified Streptomyces]MYT68271.1 hypothetical protein [Streptomyces sp. SID8367]RAJ76902.1 hypothetical protein K377_06070 [Streptomyces sp. PsTaAH-137]